MALFRFNWLRRLVRKNTTPIPRDRAALWKQRLSIVYAIIAWNAFGFVCYMIYVGKSDWAKYYGLKSKEDLNISTGHQWAKTLGLDGVKVYRVKKFAIEEVPNEEEAKNNN